MIDFVNINEFIERLKLKGPVKYPYIFVGKKNKFHPEGLFSEEIFGIEGSEEYKKSFSWIELNCKVINPVIFNILRKRIERKIDSLLSGEKRFSVSEEGYLVEDPNGEIYGMSSLVENINKIKFRRNDKEDNEFGRNAIVDRIESIIEQGLFFVDKVIVISPFYRPVVTINGGTMYVDYLNDIYIKVINLSIHMQSLTGKVKDIFVYRMQILLHELYEYIKETLSRKYGLIRDKMLGRPSDFSARGVISPNSDIKVGYVGLPLRMACQVFEPFILYGLTNSPYANSIPIEFHKKVKEFLKKELMY